MTTPRSGKRPVPQVIKIDDTLRIRWDRVYPVVRIKRPGPVSELPGSETIVSSTDVLTCADTLVFGERSGGVRDFLVWWCKELDAERHPWVLVWGSAWDRGFFQWSEHADDALRQEGNAAIEAFGREGSAIDRAKALKEWANQLDNRGRPCTLIIRHLTGLRELEAVQAAEALSVLRESRNGGSLCLVVADTSETLYLPKKDISGYWRFSSAYRLAPLDDDSVRALAARGSDDWRPLRFADKALEAFIGQTGGQPLLVQELLARLRESTDRPKAKRVSEASVIQAATRMRSAPPSVVRLWQADLTGILNEHPELRSSMETYTLGRTLGPARFPPPPEERPLFIAGWVRINRAGRWGIASELHRDLAREVLDELGEAAP